MFGHEQMQVVIQAINENGDTVGADDGMDSTSKNEA